MAERPMTADRAAELLDRLTRDGYTAHAGGAACTLIAGKGVLSPPVPVSEVTVTNADGQLLITLNLRRVVLPGDIITVNLTGVEIE